MATPLDNRGNNRRDFTQATHCHKAKANWDTLSWQFASSTADSSDFLGQEGGSCSRKRCCATFASLRVVTVCLKGFLEAKCKFGRLFKGILHQTQVLECFHRSSAKICLDLEARSKGFSKKARSQCSRRDFARATRCCKAKANFVKLCCGSLHPLLLVQVVLFL